MLMAWACGMRADIRATGDAARQSLGAHQQQPYPPAAQQYPQQQPYPPAGPQYPQQQPYPPPAPQ